MHNIYLCLGPPFAQPLCLYFRRTFPWGCVGGLLKRLVPDASPHGLPSSIAAPLPLNSNGKSTAADIAALDAELSSVTLPAKPPSMLIQRTPSLGERVLWTPNELHTTAHHPTPPYTTIPHPLLLLHISTLYFFSNVVCILWAWSYEHV